MKDKKVGFRILAYDDLYPEYGGRIKLDYGNGLGAWQDVVHILIAHGYVVTLHTESATEIDREVNHIDKWVIIEFDEA